MYVEGYIPCCDYTGETFNEEVKGIHCIAQGATGRWCTVMYMCDDYAKKHNIVPISYDEAVARIQNSGSGWVDF